MKGCMAIKAFYDKCVMRTQSYFAWFTALSQAKRYAVLLLFDVLLVLGILYVAWPSHTVTLSTKQHVSSWAAGERASLDALQRGMQRLTVQMQQLAKQQGQVSSQGKSQLQALNMQLQHLQQGMVKTAHSPSPQSEAFNKTVNTQLARLQQLIGKLQRQITPVAYLPVSQLPFQVVGVDYWNGLLRVTLHSGHSYALLSLGDSRDGYQLLSADFKTQQAVFIKKGKRYKAVVR